MIPDRTYDFNVVFQPAEEGGYNVFVPSLPGCVTQGETLDEAKRMAEEAIALYCESLISDGLSIPETTGEFIGHVAVKIQPA